MDDSRRYYCHGCARPVTIAPNETVSCPYCHSEFLELADADSDLHNFIQSQQSNNLANVFSFNQGTNDRAHELDFMRNLVHFMATQEAFQFNSTPEEQSHSENEYSEDSDFDEMEIEEDEEDEEDEDEEEENNDNEEENQSRRRGRGALLYRGEFEDDVFENDPIVRENSRTTSHRFRSTGQQSRQPAIINIAKYQNHLMQ